MIKALIDTDVNLDFVLQRQPFFTEADEIFLRCSNAEFEACICSITPINIFYVGRKEIGRSDVIQAIDDLFIDIDENLQSGFYNFAIGFEFADYRL